jgi:hypothetical protein
VGITHLIGTCKRNELIATQMDKLVCKRYHDNYSRLESLGY